MTFLSLSMTSFGMVNVLMSQTQPYQVRIGKLQNATCKSFDIPRTHDLQKF